jgi:hypothetical protein
MIAPLKQRHMIKSLIRYTKYFSHTILSSKVRKIVFADILRFCLGQKVINNTSINPWSDKSYTDEERAIALEKAIQWLLHSQNAMTDNGFGSYHLIKKWSSSYIETSGYIIPSLLDYGVSKNNSDIINKAILSVDWLLQVQKNSGGWQGQCIEDNRPEVVFNTGQVIRGLHSVYKYTSDSKYLNSAIKACDWLCEIQEEEGFWKRHAFMNVPRVDAPLLMIYAITGKEIYKEKAIKNLNWIIEEKQLKNGWFEDCDNTIKRNDKPILHTISYTIDGLLDCGILLNEKKQIDAAIKSADKLFDIFNKTKYLKGRYDANWIGSEYIITTGCAQIAIIWMKLFKLTNNVQYLNAALKMNDILIYIQDRNLKESPDTKGALPGSFPIWGKYEPFSFPNWATKFFIDSLVLEKECLKREL